MAVTAGGEIHTGRESKIGIGFPVLCVRPCQLEVGLFGIVGHTLVAEYGNEVTEEKVSGEFVAFDVCRLSVETP